MEKLESEFNCDSCANKLANIVLFPGDVPNSVSFYCPICEAKTFVKQFMGTVFIDVLDTYSVLDVNMDGSEFNSKGQITKGKQLLKLGIRKNG